MKAYPVYSDGNPTKSHTVISVYRPCIHIHYRDGKLYHLSGTKNVIEGLSENQSRQLRVREYMWRFLFEKCCGDYPRIIGWLFRRVNAWRVEGT